jgi:glycosyltransferase involved in cell wall biosynthesis
MGTARPIILGVRGESEELLREAGAGLAVPPESAQALAEALTNLMDDPSLCRDLGAAGRRFVETHSDRQRHALEMLKVLQGAVFQETAHPSRVEERAPVAVPPRIDGTRASSR